MSSIDWGDAPTWIAAVFAGGAALFAGLTIRSQRQQIAEQREFIGEQSQNLRLEREALEAGRQDRRRAQAELVFVRKTPQGMGLVTNSSGSPITLVTLRAGDTPAVNAGIHKEGNVLGADGERASLPFPLIGSERGATFSFGAIWREIAQNRETLVAAYTDADGVRWEMDEHGLLVELVDEE
ncbi:hypothetical protein ACFQ6C_07650 [Streptomyces sp. NPDC056454]|uniref:hypothetical protein n=1 Tax=Streptomyces sp. NPDC056454 TaxID=3345823 RepID=UPI0036A447A6